MAKILHGSLIADVRGKVGSVVFQGGPFGSVLHLASRPRRSAGVVASFQRAETTRISHSWSSDLSESERVAWSSFAAAHPVKTRSGRTVNLPASQMFLRLNFFYFWWNAAIQTSPPASLFVEPLDYVTIGCDVSLNYVNISFSPTPIPANHFMAYWPSGPFNPGRKHFLSRVLGGFWYLDAGAASGVAITSNWTARYGAIPATGRLSVRARLVNALTGAFTPLSSNSETIVP